MFSGFGTWIFGRIVALLWFFKKKGDKPDKSDNDTTRLALYDKRFKIYEAGMQYIAQVIRSAEPSDEDINNINYLTSESVFLFNDEIADHIKTVRNKGIELRELNRKIKKTPLGSREALTSEMCEMLNWFDKQQNEFPNKFKSYLKFKK